ncbi:hypothetical protein [Vreelandella venusta]|uniref:Uncharacterized protein n=1 Tax=Vreelandella venusta TaxID=44935 RepID=A0ABX2BDF2_9GAMM|nr:hypothetical protein [Halomonas venusta]AZM96081.1 hypothetical protein EI420_10470 [Halomonas venusta]NPT30630.1 hypothetical protein [Halomonas venusta]
MIKRILGNLSGWMIAALLGITIFAGMQARQYALQLSATETRLARAHDQVEILQEHQRWKREQINTLSAVLSARDEQLQRDTELVDMMRNTARQLERDDATTHDWASQPVPAVVGDWVRELPEAGDSASAGDAGVAPASGNATE